MSVLLSPSVIVPDYKSDFIGALRSVPEITAIVPADKIRTRLRDVTGEPSNWLILIKSGGWGSDPYVPLMHAFMTLHFYGSSGYEAMRMWRTVKSTLQDPNRRESGFTFGGTNFYDIIVGMPNEYVEPGKTPWDKIVAYAELRMREVPIL